MSQERFNYKRQYLFVVVLFHIISPLCLGTLLYFFFGKKGTVLSNIFIFFTENKDILKLKEHLQTNFSPPDFLIYQLPDALWAYAFCASLLLIWQGQKAALVTFIAFDLCFFYEIMQYMEWTAGTFDWWDVVVMGLACWCAFYFNRN